MKDFDVFISQDGQTYRYLINNANFESYVIRLGEQPPGHFYVLIASETGVVSAFFI